MHRVVDVYYDFRSPYAYFVNCRIASGLIDVDVDVDWRWHPVSIDILINLQAGQDSWAPYFDPLVPAKRRYLMPDIIRSARFYQIPLLPPKPARPAPVPALCVALALEADPEAHRLFRFEVFNAVWRDQRDIADPAVLADCLRFTGAELAIDPDSAPLRRLLEERTIAAYAQGIFGVPTLVLDGDLFFGADRLDMLAWALVSESGG